MDALNKKVAIGAGWAIFTRLLVKSLGLISTVILARVLAPEDFGVIAMCMIIIAFLEVFTSFGFDINIIQRDKVCNRLLDSAWTLKLVTGGVLTLILVVISEYIGLYYDDTRLVQLTLVLSCLPLISSLQNIGFVLYRKKLDLTKEFRLEVVSKLGSFIATIGFAIFLENYWALVIGMYVNAVMKVIMSFLMHPYRPHFSLVYAQELFKFSKWLLLNNLLIFFNHKITDLFIGKQSSAQELGFYTVGYEISNLPTTELVFPLSRAIFPGYAKIREDKSLLKKMFLQYTTVIIFFAAPISFGIAVLSKDIVAILLGDKWEGVEDIIYILAFYGLIRASVSNAGSVFLAIGKPMIPVVISTIRLVLIIPLLFFLVPTNLAVGGAWSVLLVSCIVFFMSLGSLAYCISIDFKEYLSIFLPPVIVSSIMYFTLLLLQENSYFTSSLIIGFIMQVSLGAVIYLLLIILYFRIYQTEHFSFQLMEKIKEILKGKL